MSRAAVWLGLTTAMGATAAVVLVMKLRAAAGGLSPSEVSGFSLSRWGDASTPMNHTERHEVNGVELITFERTYGLRRLWRDGDARRSAKADPLEVVAFRHAHFFCVLPTTTPSLAVWSRTATWDVPWAELLIAPDASVDPAFDAAFSVQASADGAALLDAELQAFLLHHADWSFQLCGDALLAFRGPPVQVTSLGAGRSPASSADLAVFSALAAQVRRVSQLR